MLASSVSVSPYEPGLVDSVGRVLLVSSTPSDSYSLSSPPFHEVPEAPRGGLSGDLQLRLFLCLVSGCGSLYLLPSAAGGSVSVSDDNWTENPSTRIEEYHWEPFN